MSKKLIFCLLSCALFFASNAHASGQQLPPQKPVTYDQHLALLIFSCQRKPIREEKEEPQEQEQYTRKAQKPPRSAARKNRAIKQSREEEPKSEDWLQEQAKLVAQHVATLQ